jgi:hypothetical protein
VAVDETSAWKIPGDVMNATVWLRNCGGDEAGTYADTKEVIRQLQTRKLLRTFRNAKKMKVMVVVMAGIL